MARKRAEVPRERRCGPAARSVLMILGGGLLALQGHAQDAAGARGVVVVPRLAVSETYTDNLKLSTGDGDAALITTVSPGLSIASRTGRIRGALDYALNGVVYTKSEERNQIRHTLSSQANVEAIENWLFINGTANISVQPVSAFGTVVPGSNDLRRNGNSTEVASLTLSPSVRGRLGGWFSYRATLNAAESRAKDGVAGDNRSHGFNLSIAGLGDGRVLNWALALDGMRGSPGSGRSTRTESATGSLDIRPDVDWRFGLTAGSERSDLSAVRSTTAPTYGASAQWTPTPRTQANASWNRHDYGNAHALTFQHRMARSVWRISDQQSVSQPGIQGLSGRRTNYELMFLQFEGLEPDPVRRDALVRAFLQSAGLSPDAISTAGYLTATSTLQRRQEMSFALQGVRSSLTFALSRSRSHRLDLNSQAADDLDQSEHLTQRGFTLSMSHRLTPDDTATLGYTLQQSRGDAARQSSELRSLVANWSVRLGRRTSVQLGLRRTSFDSPIQPYRENALLANLLQQF